MKKRLVIIIATVLGFIIVAVAMIDHKNSFSAAIRTEIVPSESTLTIDGKAREEGIIKVRPGEHKIIVSKEGFASSSRTIRVTKEETKYVGVILVSNSSTTASWYLTHSDDAKKAEGISSSSFDISTQELAKKNPFIRELPFIDQFYRIDYGPSKIYPNDPNKVAFYIKYYSEQGKQQALELLRFKGYDPANLEVIYTAARP